MTDGTRAAVTLRNAVAGLAGTVSRSLLEAVFPPKCMVCSEIFEVNPPPATVVAAELGEMVCPDCMPDLQPVGSPLCVCCGRVFPSRAGEDRVCGECVIAPKHYRRVRAALLYTDSCARLVHRFKYEGKIQLARPLGRILFRCLQQHWQPHEIDWVVPVPLHRRRLKRRGFNQVEQMVRQWAPSGREPSGARGAPEVAWELVTRTALTRPQTELGRKERLTNLRNAFQLKQSRSLEGKRLLLVDDVYTTGATVGECARLLRGHGARRVDVLTLARAD